MPEKITRDIAVSEIMQSLRRIFKAIQDYSYEVSDQFGITGWDNGPTTLGLQNHF